MYFDSNFEACPISEELLGQIYRAGPEGVESEVSNLPPTARARLAAFCYAGPICTRSVSPSRQPATSAP